MAVGQNGLRKKAEKIDCFLFADVYNSQLARSGVRVYLKAAKLLLFYIDFPDSFYENAVLCSLEGYPSGQRGQTVNLLFLTSEVRILLPPPFILSPK